MLQKHQLSTTNQLNFNVQPIKHDSAVKNLSCISLRVAISLIQTLKKGDQKAPKLSDYGTKQI